VSARLSTIHNLRIRTGEARAALVITAAFVLFMGVQACGGETGPTPTAASADADGTFSVLHRNYAFEPKRLSFGVGETVEFQLNSKDEIHTFTVRKLGVNWVVTQEAKPQAQSFTFDRPGTYRLICTIPGHEGSGMVGEITVE
jgi:plastocyanin